jgi:hypothetical protein
MKRRTFVVTSLLAGSAAVIPFLIKGRLNASRKPLCLPDALSHFCGKEKIRQIGLRYRSMFPNETRETLVSLILDKNVSNASEYEYDPENLEKKIRNEFQSNNTIVVNGWILTLTEARQCALLTYIK